MTRCKCPLMTHSGRRANDSLERPLSSAAMGRIISPPKRTDRGAIMATVTANTATSAWYWNRWSQLVLGLIAMMSISSPQYVWTLFTGPLNQKLGTTLAELQWTFSLLIILQTWCSPLQAYLVDRFGPRTLIAVGALMSGGGWVLSAYTMPPKAETRSRTFPVFPRPPETNLDMNEISVSGNI